MLLLCVIESSLFLLSGHLFYLRDNPLIDSSLVTLSQILSHPSLSEGHLDLVNMLSWFQRAFLRD